MFGKGSAIVIASNIVTTITALSMCAIATNGEVGGGGAYFLISRALGPQFGGPIGILFFVAQAVATSMYVVGFSDALLDIVKKGGGTPFTGSCESCNFQTQCKAFVSLCFWTRFADHRDQKATKCSTCLRDSFSFQLPSSFLLHYFEKGLGTNVSSALLPARSF